MGFVPFWGNPNGYIMPDKIDFISTQKLNHFQVVIRPRPVVYPGLVPSCIELHRTRLGGAKGVGGTVVKEVSCQGNQYLLLGHDSAF